MFELVSKFRVHESRVGAHPRPAAVDHTPVSMSTRVHTSRELCEVMFLFKYVSQRILMGLLLNDVAFAVKDVSERCRFSRIPLNVVSLLKDTPERSVISRFLTECQTQ